MHRSGLASRTGTLTWIRDGKESKFSGLLQEDKTTGHWVERSANGNVFEGPYVDGKRQGRWVRRFPNGRKQTLTYVNGVQQ